MQGETFVDTNKRTILSNDLKKGDRVRLTNGWWATVQDNRKGNTRTCTVEGFFTETGSVYSHEIFYRLNKDGSQEYIEHTPAQTKLKRDVEMLFGEG